MTNRSIGPVCDFTDTTELLARLRRAGLAHPRGRPPGYGMFGQNPNHPSLRFKKLGGYEQIWSIRVNEQYRVVGERDGDQVIWVWIGTHNEFDKLFG